ncbi:ketopantoate reductase family protein [Roseomonas sp. KE2513]|uniref:ketopantoate reductase family protein n=1 Tax=Roseomonas sp. KE2513 TaxID=2479202 RepID=UPI0018E02698|nr:ketopantoate reductase family protein [Roseomonas sp. KE2513]MBI0538201.1 ketopantoate reductase family protein [Roseomonas sp. KE2513]
MRILVIGCGAIGGVVVAALSSVAEVTGFDTNSAHVAAIRENGLSVTGAGAPVTARFAVADDPASLAKARFEAAIFLVKSGATGAAAAALGPALEGAALLTLQNGMGNAEALERLPNAVIARGVTMDAGRYLGPGRVERLIHGQPTWIGPVRGPAEALRPLGDSFRAAGLPTEVIDDPMGAVWAKFVFNAVMNPVGALVLGVNAARYEVAAVRDLIDEMAAECTAVVHALGGTFAFDPMGFVRKVRAGEVPLSRHAGSMALDIARGAPTEIEELTGYVVREGERLGVPVPACRTVYRLVKGLELAARVRATEAAGGAS